MEYNLIEKIRTITKIIYISPYDIFFLTLYFDFFYCSRHAIGHAWIMLRVGGCTGTKNLFSTYLFILYKLNPSNLLFWNAFLGIKLNFWETVQDEYQLFVLVLLINNIEKDGNDFGESWTPPLKWCAKMFR